MCMCGWGPPLVVVCASGQLPGGGPGDKTFLDLSLEELL